MCTCCVELHVTVSDGGQDLRETALAEAAWIFDKRDTSCFCKTASA